MWAGLVSGEAGLTDETELQCGFVTRLSQSVARLTLAWDGMEVRCAKDVLHTSLKETNKAIQLQTSCSNIACLKRFFGRLLRKEKDYGIFRMR